MASKAEANVESKPGGELGTAITFEASIDPFVFCLVSAAVDAVAQCFTAPGARVWVFGHLVDGSIMGLLLMV